MYYGKEKHARILIGKDTRLSGDMFELGLAAGATSNGSTSVFVRSVPYTGCKLSDSKRTI